MKGNSSNKNVFAFAGKAGHEERSFFMFLSFFLTTKKLGSARVVEGNFHLHARLALKNR